METMICRARNKIQSSRGSGNPIIIIIIITSLPFLFLLTTAVCCTGKGKNNVPFAYRRKIWTGNNFHTGENLNQTECPETGASLSM